MNKEKKTEVLRIRCSPETLARFNGFAARYIAMMKKQGKRRLTRENALTALLNGAGEPKPTMKPYWIKEEFWKEAEENAKKE